MSVSSVPPCECWDSSFEYIATSAYPLQSFHFQITRGYITSEVDVVSLNSLQINLYEETNVNNVRVIMNM